MFSNGGGRSCVLKAVAVVMSEEPHEVAPSANIQKWEGVLRACLSQKEQPGCYTTKGVFLQGFLEHADSFSLCSLDY